MFMYSGILGSPSQGDFKNQSRDGILTSLKVTMYALYYLVKSDWRRYCLGNT